MTNGPRRRFALRAAYAVALALLIAYAYGPSLKHLPRADDWWYYLNTLETHTFKDTFLASHSYARTRTVMPGDEFIYRPLFFALLAFKKDGIGPHFAWHQAFPLALHFIFCFMTMLVLASLRDLSRDPTSPHSPTPTDHITSALVYVVPAFLAVNAALVDAVIWTHINGYLLFYVLLLAVIYLFLRGSNPQHVSSKRFGVLIAALLLASAFIYEYGQFYAVILVPWALFWNRPFRDRLILAAALLCIPLVYQSANAIDKRYNAAKVDDVQAMHLYTGSAPQILSPETFKSIARFTRYAGGVPLFASTASMAEKEERVLIHELSIRRALAESPNAFLILAVLPLWMLLAVLGYAKAIRELGWGLPGFAVTLAAFFGLYALGISLVRVNPDANVELVLAGSSYYMYWPFMLLITIATGGFFLFASNARSVFARITTTIVAVALIAALTIEGAASAVHLNRFNASLADQQAPAREIVEAVNRFFDSHPGAKVAFDLQHSAPVPDTWDLGVPLTTLLFRAHEDNFDPDFLVRIVDGEPVAVPHTAATDEPLAPHLVQVHEHINIYQHNGKYHALLRFEGRYDPQRVQDYRYLRSNNEIEALIPIGPELVEERNRDVAAGLLRDRYWH